MFGVFSSGHEMTPRTKQHIGAAVITLVVLRVLVTLADDYLFFWYVMVRDVVYLRAALYPATALLLSGASIVVFMFFVANARKAARPLAAVRGMAYVSGVAFVLGGILYLAEAVVRVGSLLRGEAWMGAGLAALTVGVWVGVSVCTWIVSLQFVSRLSKHAVRAGA